MTTFFRDKLAAAKKKLAHICPIDNKPTEHPNFNARSWQCEHCQAWHKQNHDASLIK